MENENLKKLQEAIIKGEITQIVKCCILLSIDLGASDIHIEPAKTSVRIRLRVDGELREIIEYPSNIHVAVIARIKIRSGLKIDEQRKPQDGRLVIMTDDNREVGLRVSVLPTIHGEKIVMRLQDKGQKVPSYTELGITGNNLDRLIEVLKNPNGVTLVTGPTGSGKTTTLYSILQELNTIDVNIMTLEDPVEYEMLGLAQSQIRPDIGYDFFSGLRTALRQDPDIIMVGEIRDQETIEVAIKAALTGHMVLSTIHTNSAVSTVTRIMDMGVKPFKITSAIRMIEAQRLVRRICPHCKEEYEPEEVIKDEIRKNLANCRDREVQQMNLDKITLFKGKGCDKCINSGYQGRKGVYEILLMNREVVEMILEKAHEHDIKDKCVEHGMVTLLHDGVMKALQGETTIEEVYRVTTAE